MFLQPKFEALRLNVGGSKLKNFKFLFLESRRTIADLNFLFKLFDNEIVCPNLLSKFSINVSPLNNKNILLLLFWKIVQVSITFQSSIRPL